jgi:rhomboid protease GluP
MGNPLTIPKSKPIFTDLTLCILGSMFLLEIILTFKTHDFSKTLIILGAKWNTAINDGEYWRLITYGFLHGNLIHLLLNMIALHVFGREVEMIYGNVRFLIIFLLSILVAGITSYNFSNGIAIGASGGLFGVLGSLMYFFYKEKKEIVGAEMRFKSMYTLLIINIVFGFLIPNIDNSAHFGGLISGAILAFILAPKYEIVSNNNKITIQKYKKQTFEAIGLLLYIAFTFLLFYQTIMK